MMYSIKSFRRVASRRRVDHAENAVVNIIKNHIIRKGQVIVALVVIDTIIHVATGIR